jgi:hypothetical protein
MLMTLESALASSTNWNSGCSSCLAAGTGDCISCGAQHDVFLLFARTPLSRGPADATAAVRPHCRVRLQNELVLIHEVMCGRRRASRRVVLGTRAALHGSGRARMGALKDAARVRQSAEAPTRRLRRGDADARPRRSAQTGRFFAARRGRQTRIPARSPDDWEQLAS